VRVIHPEVVAPGTVCPVYACTLAQEDHYLWPDQFGQTWHYDDQTGVHWPTDAEESADADEVS